MKDNDNPLGRKQDSHRSTNSNGLKVLKNKAKEEKGVQIFDCDPDERDVNE
jgi:hypothetical protein